MKILNASILEYYVVCKEKLHKDFVKLRLCPIYMELNGIGGFHQVSNIFAITGGVFALIGLIVFAICKIKAQRIQQEDNQ